MQNCYKINFSCLPLEVLKVNLIPIFGTKVPRHSQPALQRVHLLGRSIRMVVARFHSSLANAALDGAPATPARITIDDGRGEVQYITSGVMLDGWYLVESSDAHAEPDAPKGFYLLPLQQEEFNLHHGTLPYLEFAEPGFSAKFLKDKAQARRTRLYVLWQLIETTKDEEPTASAPATVPA